MRQEAENVRQPNVFFIRLKWSLVITVGRPTITLTFELCHVHEGLFTISSIETSPAINNVVTYTELFQEGELSVTVADNGE